MFQKVVPISEDTCPNGFKLFIPSWRLFSKSDPVMSGKVLLKVDKICRSRSIISVVRFWCPVKYHFTLSHPSLMLNGTGVIQNWEEFQSHFNTLRVDKTANWSPSQETVCWRLSTSVASCVSKSRCSCHNKWESLCQSRIKSAVWIPWCNARPATAAVAVTDATARIEAMTTPSICRDWCSKVCTVVTRRETAKESDHGLVRFIGNHISVRALTITNEKLELQAHFSNSSHQDWFTHWVRLQ